MCGTFRACARGIPFRFLPGMCCAVLVTLTRAVESVVFHTFFILAANKAHDAIIYIALKPFL